MYVCVVYVLQCEGLVVLTLAIFAGDALKTLDPVQFGKWNSYLLLKASFYEAYVSHFTVSAIVQYEPHLPTVECCLCDVICHRHTASLVRSCLRRRSVGNPSRCCSTAKHVSVCGCTGIQLLPMPSAWVAGLSSARFFGNINSSRAAWIFQYWCDVPFYSFHQWLTKLLNCVKSMPRLKEQAPLQGPKDTHSSRSWLLWSNYTMRKAWERMDSCKGTVRRGWYRLLFTETNSLKTATIRRCQRKCLPLRSTRCMGLPHLKTLHCLPTTHSGLRKHMPHSKCLRRPVRSMTVRWGTACSAAHWIGIYLFTWICMHAACHPFLIDAHILPCLWIHPLVCCLPWRDQSCSWARHCPRKSDTARN